jgi:hypothetical protein
MRLAAILALTMAMAPAPAQGTDAEADAILDISVAWARETDPLSNESYLADLAALAQDASPACVAYASSLFAAIAIWDTAWDNGTQLGMDWANLIASMLERDAYSCRIAT